MGRAKDMTVQIITPYVDDAEIQQHMDLYWDLDVYYEKDEAGIGSDLMFQKMWNRFPDKDIFILHADMYPYQDNWLEDVKKHVEKYPEAGMFGCLLLYPAKNKEEKHYIQCAGGKFTDNKPDHYGSGIIIETGQTFKKDLEVDEGQYNNVREVAWTTFGGCYIRRSFIDIVGNFSADYEWTYNRDVDYCLKGREQGQKIYQVPVRLFHHESKDNKRIKANNPTKAAMEMRNLQRLQAKWANTNFYKNLDKQIKS